MRLKIRYDEKSSKPGLSISIIQESFSVWCTCTVYYQHQFCDKLIAATLSNSISLLISPKSTAWHVQKIDALTSVSPPYNLLNDATYCER
jgi:hypothetical protein